MADGAYTTPAAVKTFLLQSPGVTTDLGLIESLINGVSQEFLTEMQRDGVLSADYTDIRNGTGTRVLTLINYPITAVSSVTEGWPGQQQRTLVYQTDYIFTKFSIKRICGVFVAGVANYTVNYTAGLSAVPSDLVNAATKAVAYRYLDLMRLGENSKTMGQETVAFQKDPWPKDVQRTLSFYSRKSPIPVT